MKPQSITFCFPYRGVGGVPMQFARLATELAARGHEVFAVDYADGCLARNARDPRVRLLGYDDRRAVQLPGDTLAVFQTMTPWSIFPSLRLEARTRTLFWTCHPFNLVPTIPVLRHWIQRGPRTGAPLLRRALPGYWRIAREFARTLLATHSILFMDRGNLTNTERYLQLDLHAGALLPVPVALPPTVRPTLAPARRLHIGWVGRIVDFKYHILRRALLELERAAQENGYEIRVSVVGDGDHRARLERDCGRLRYLAVDFRGRLEAEAVAGFLRDEVEVLLAMGTAAIEGAALGIPTVLLDFSYRPVPEDYTFNWVHRASGYSLGALIGAEHRGGARSMDRLLADVHGDYAALARAVRDYVAVNHALDAVCTRLLELAAQASCTWGELQSAGLLARGWLYQMHRHWRARVAA
jgi:glycosyltransferase involved in cell wall biosynthesis